MLIGKTVPFRYIFKQVRADVARVFMFSVCFELLGLYFGKSMPIIPGQLATILGSAISLILAFKINQSYDRWWEARKVWGAIVNDSRSFALQVKAFLQNHLLGAEGTQAAVTQLVHRQIAWCYSLSQALRGQDATDNLASLLTEEELAYIRQQNNKPFALLALHANHLQLLRQQQALETFEHVQIDNTLVRLCDSMGKAERINSTIFPVTYRLLVHMFIYLFLVALSLSLVETIGWVELPILLAFATIFFLLEKTATYLQDPFRNKPTDTPMTAISRNIEINLKQLLEEKEIPQPITAESFYLL